MNLSPLEQQRQLTLHFQPFLNGLILSGITLETIKSVQASVDDSLLINRSDYGLAQGDASALAASFAQNSLSMWQAVEFNFINPSPTAERPHSYSHWAGRIQKDMLRLLMQAAGIPAALLGIQECSLTATPANLPILLVQTLQWALRRYAATDQEATVLEMEPYLPKLHLQAAHQERKRWALAYPSFLLDGLMDRDGRESVARLLAPAIRLGAQHPQTDAFLARYLGLVMSGNDWEACDFIHAGSACAQHIGRWGVQGKTLPSLLLNVMGPRFVGGLMNQFKHDSLIGTRAFNHLLSALHGAPNQSTRTQTEQTQFEAFVISSIWLGLDRQRIEAFEAACPHLSAQPLRPALQAYLADDFLAPLNLEETLAHKSSGWAKKAFLSGNGSLSNAQILDGFDAVQALLQAKALSAATRSTSPSAARRPRKAKGKTL